MHAPRRPSTLDLPIVLSRLTPEEITWLAAKSAQNGKSTAEVAKDLLARAAQADGFKPESSTPLPS